MGTRRTKVLQYEKNKEGGVHVKDLPQDTQYWVLRQNIPDCGGGVDAMKMTLEVHWKRNGRSSNL